LTYFLYKSEYKILKPVEITIRMGTEAERIKMEGMKPAGFIIHIYMEMSQ
jgi:hypothetical protein